LAVAAVLGSPDDVTSEAVCAFVVLKRAADRREGQADCHRVAQLGGQGDRADRRAQRHPLRRQPAQDSQRQDHAAAAAQHPKGEATTQASTLENPAVLEQLPHASGRAKFSIAWQPETKEMSDQADCHRLAIVHVDYAKKFCNQSDQAPNRIRFAY